MVTTTVLKTVLTVLAAGLLLPCVSTRADNDDFASFEDDEARLRAVNTGDLEFLAGQRDGALQTRSKLHISAASLDDGWVGLEQCQHQLDAVGVAEIVYVYTGLRGLKISEQAGIDTAWVDGRGVQLRGVQRNAHICVHAEVQVLRKEVAGRYRIDSGPYHRRFLDGYFPLHLVLSVDFPPQLLQWSRLEPAPRPGLDVTAQAGAVTVDASFVGKLTLHLYFSRP